MHILFLPSWYSTNRNPVHGTFFKEQAQALKRNGIKVSIGFNEVWPITLFGKIKEKKRLSFDIEDGLNTYRYKNFNYLPKNPLMFKFFNKRYDKLFKKIEKEEGKIDVIHAHSSFWAGIGGLYLSKKYNIPLVITEHSSLKNSRYVKESYKKYIIESYKKANKLVAVSNSLKKELYDLCKRDDIEVINNIVNLSKFKIANKGSSRIAFFSCGFLDVGKGFDVLIKAFNKAFKGKDAILRIGGEGEEREKLENLIKELSLEKQVILLGSLSRDEVSKEMQECTGFVLASRHETFGVVYIEALASGKPVIGTKNGGANEIITSSNGLIVDIDDINALSKALLNLSKNKDKFNSKEIRENCISLYSENVIIPKIISLYEEII